MKTATDSRTTRQPDRASRPPENSSLAGRRIAPLSHTIPAKWKWHHRTLLRLRDRLVRAHAEHEGQVAVPLETSGVDVVDTIQDQLDRDLLWAELGVEDNKLEEIDAALQRIHDGTYGRCEATGQAIPLARLFVLPWTRYCRSAAEQIEAAEEKAKKRTGRIFIPRPDEDGVD